MRLRQDRPTRWQQVPDGYRDLGPAEAERRGALAGPLRMCYVAPVFRTQERGLGRLREFTQAGVELLGASSPDGDAEVIALAVESLRAAGVPGATIRLGHLGLLNDLLQELPEGLQA